MESNLKEENEKKLYKYLNKNWLNKNYNIYNYYELIEKYEHSNLISHFYVTNNIAESLHSKFKLYFPNKKCTNVNFIIALKNVIKNTEIK